MATREAVLHPAYSIRTITKMSICVALCCVSAYISIPLPFTTAMITALTVVMNLTAFILKPKQTLIVMLVWILLGSAGLPVFVGERQDSAGCSDRQEALSLHSPSLIPLSAC